MILVIHTLQFICIELALMTDGGEVLHLSHTTLQNRQTEQVTPSIDQLLRRARTHLSDLQGLVVATGPGGFTAVRSGVVVANALGLALGIPVKGMIGEFSSITDMLSTSRFSRLCSAFRHPTPSFARPAYGAEPHISRAKKKKVQQHSLKI